MLPSSRPARSKLPEAVHAILAQCGLSLAEVARQSRRRFSGNRLYRIPPNFYEALRRNSFTPSLHQFFALSTLSGYRLADWLEVFGFSFDEAARFQASRPRYYTCELDARIYHPEALIPWFDETQVISLGADPAPLSRWLAGRVLRPVNSLSGRINPSFRYLKIGSRDAYAFPDLVPGSIVRVDGRIPFETLSEEDQKTCIVAIEHCRGLVCGHLRRGSRGRVVLCSRQLPYAPVELDLQKEARILGVVDTEIRRLDSPEAPEVPANAGKLWKPVELKSVMVAVRLGDWLRRARMRSGLSIREASERTAELARVLKHPNYFCAASALSDLEACDLFPRHVHKVISLCAVYGLPVAEFCTLRWNSMG